MAYVVTCAELSVSVLKLALGQHVAGGKMNIAEIEARLKELVEQPFEPETFIFRFIEIYDAPKATVTKLRQGSSNQATAPDVLWKNKLYFRVSTDGKAAEAIDAMAVDPLTRRHAPRFLVATDGTEVHCRDTKADDRMDVAFGKLNDIFDFFLPLAGIERYNAVAENPADIKATGRLAKLYDSILEKNPDWISRNHTHELNLFMTRMLFCFFRRGHVHLRPRAVHDDPDEPHERGWLGHRRGPQHIVHRDGHTSGRTRRSARIRSPFPVRERRTVP